MYMIEAIWVMSVSAGSGYYARARLEDIGWWVENYGPTAEQATQNLIDYIRSGKFDADRNR